MLMLWWYEFWRLPWKADRNLNQNTSTHTISSSGLFIAAAAAVCIYVYFNEDLHCTLYCLMYRWPVGNMHINIETSTHCLLISFYFLHCLFPSIFSSFPPAPHTPSLHSSISFFYLKSFALCVCNFLLPFFSPLFSLPHSLSIAHTGCKCCARGCQAVTTETLCIIDGVCLLRPTKQHPNCPSRAQQAVLLSN